MGLPMHTYPAGKIYSQINHYLERVSSQLLWLIGVESILHLGAIANDQQNPDSSQGTLWISQGVLSVAQTFIYEFASQIGGCTRWSGSHRFQDVAITCLTGAFVACGLYLFFFICGYLLNNGCLFNFIIILYLDRWSICFVVFCGFFCCFGAFFSPYFSMLFVIFENLGRGSPHIRAISGTGNDFCRFVGVA